MAKKEGTKLCRYCKTEIPASAKVCPQCRKNQGGGCLTAFITIACLLFIFYVIGTSGKDDNKNSSNSNSSGKQQSESQETESKITYTSYTVTQMMNDLESNAMKASETYKDQYVEITGRLGVIDSDGKYISLYPEDNEWAIVGVQCSIVTDEQKKKVTKMEKGSTITLRGKITSVGEILGYSLEIDSIVKY